MNGLAASQPSDSDVEASTKPQFSGCLRMLPQSAIGWLEAFEVLA
jgi:hypothetical protein